MDRSLIKRLLTPGRLPRYGVFIASIITMIVICWLDIEDGTDVRLRILYVFPLTALALHSSRTGPVVFGLVLTVCCQIFTLIFYALPLDAKVTEGIIGIAGYLLIVMLARTTRENYLETLRLSTQDALTGLHNRRSFESIATLEIARQKRYGGLFSLVAIDLDNFKQLNDSKGHQIGDLALKLVADVLREHSRQTDTIARIGGDEFVILMPNTDQNDCAGLCEQYSSNIASRMDATEYSTKASIGFKTFEQAPASTLDALHQADMAMYAVKANKQSIPDSH